MGQPLYCSAANAGVCGGREAMMMSPPLACDSAALPLFHGCPAFLHRYLPTTVSSLTPPWSVSPQSTGALAWGLLHNPQTPAPNSCAFRGSVSLSGVCVAAARAVWFSFHLGCHRSAVSLSAVSVSPLTQTVTPLWGSDPCFCSPTCWGQVQSY